MADTTKEFSAEKDSGSDPSLHDRDHDEVHGEEEETFAGRDEEDVVSGHGPANTTLKTPNEATRSALSRIITGQSTTASLRDPGPPPDGGFNAWLQVAMGHLVIFNTWGFVSSFGVFQTYYARTLNHPPSDISWVGSTQIFLLFAIGTLSGRATDAGLFRPVFVAGYIVQLLGLFMTSLSTKYYQLFLAQGLCVGIGNGLQFCPTMSLISTYFAKNRSLAIGIVASGSATGGLIYPVLVQQLLPTIGFGWTMRVLGFVTMGTGAVAAAFLRTRVPPRQSGPLLELSAFKEPAYALYCIGMFFCFWALYFGFYYVSDLVYCCSFGGCLDQVKLTFFLQVGAYGRDIVGISYSESINILLIMNGVGYVGRLLPNYMADRCFGPLNTIVPFGFICGILMFAWSGVHERGGLIAFSVVYGLFAAGIQSMFPATLASLTTDLKKAGVRMGMCFSVVSVAALTGPPLAGALIQSNGGNYLHAQMWAGAILTCGSLTLVAARITKIGFTFRKRI